MGAAGRVLPHHGVLHRLQGNLCSGAWSTCSPSFFTDLGVCRIISLTYSLFSLPAAVVQFFPLLKFILSQTHYHYRWWARPWPAAGQSWSWLAYVLLDMGAAFSSFSQKMDPHRNRLLCGAQKLSFGKCHFITEWLFYLILFTLICWSYYCSTVIGFFVFKRWWWVTCQFSTNGNSLEAF